MKIPVSRIRVPAGFCLAGVFFFLSRPTLMSLIVGGAIALGGLLIRAWASGHIRKNSRLAVSGPYAFSRNPLYFGSFVIGIGFVIAGGSLIFGALFLFGFSILYSITIKQEREFLRSRFPDEYAEYEKRVPLFFPLPWRFKMVQAAFSWAQYRRNREYEAFLGFVGVMALLFLKSALKWP